MTNKIFKNALMLAVTVMMATGLSVTAFAAKDCAPGCDCSSGTDGKGVLGQMERHGDVIRTRDKAYAQQIFKQPDNTMGMTCFDRSLAVSSRLGQIFSDKVQSGAVKAMDTTIFGSSSFPSMGMDKMLGTELNKVLSPKLDAHVKNFLPSNVSSGSLSSVLGATNMGFLNTFAGGLQGDLNSIINGPIADVRSVSDTFNGILGTVTGLMPLLKTLPPVTVVATVSTIEGLLDGADSVVTQAMGLAMQAARGLFSTLAGKVMGQANSMAGNPCARLDQLWSGKNSPGGFKSVIGSGIEKGTPYFSIDSLMNGNISNAGPDFMQAVLNNAGSTNSPLSKALKDIQGPLSGPGKMPSWTTPPIFTPGMSTDDVIQMMGGGGVGDLGG